MSHKRDGVALPFNPPFAFCIFDRFLRFVMGSQMLAKLTGYSVEELSVMGMAEITSLESMEATLHSLDHIDQSGWSHHDLTFFRKDGLQVKAHLDTIPIGNAQYLSIFTQLQFKKTKSNHHIGNIHKPNCWEVLDCGRQPGGTKVSEFGTCPAATTEALNGMNGGINGGRACWAVSGTLCEGQGAYTAKVHDCHACRFYQSVIEEEGTHLTDRLKIRSRPKEH